MDNLDEINDILINEEEETSKLLICHDVLTVQ